MRKLFKHIGMICLALAVAIGSLFVPLKFDNHITYANSDNTITSYSFQGSNIFMPVARNNTSNVSCYDVFLISFNFTIDNSNNTFSVSYPNSTGFVVRDSYNYQGTTFNYNLISIINDNGYFNRPLSTYFNSSGVGFSDYLYYQANSSDDFWVRFAILGSNNPINSEIVSCTLGYTNEPWSGFSLNSNFVKYTDLNGNYISFFIETHSGNIHNLSDRVYYFSDGVDYSENQLYNQGYNQGLLDNQQNVYNNGYTAGFDVGFNDGKSEGIVEANDYSFISLFGALFDAPVAMLMGLLNFEFLGINLWAFITSLFTLALVLFIVKLIMGR